MSIRRTYKIRHNERDGTLGTILAELVGKTEPEDSQLVQFDGAQEVTVVGGSGSAYDSGRQVLPNTETSVTAVDTTVTAIILSNQTSQVQNVSIKDGLGNLWINAYPMKAKEFLVLGFNGAAFASGVKWWSDGTTVIIGQVVGRQ